MKVTVHSVLFLCALCVLIWGGVSIAAQDKKRVVEKATAAREVVDAAKVLAEKVREANKDFRKNTTELDTLFRDILKGVTTAVNKAKGITTESLNKNEVVRYIEEMKAKITDAKIAAHQLKNAEAASLKASEQADIDTNLQALEDKMKQLENAANDMTDDDASIDDVAQKAEDLKNVAQEAVTFWTDIKKELKLQVVAANRAVKKITEAINEVGWSIEYLEGSKDAKAVEAQNIMENVVSAKLKTLLVTAEKIHAASLQAYSNAKGNVGKYGTVKTAAGELEQAARDSKNPTGS